jgi:anthranilate synthase component II
VRGVRLPIAGGQTRPEPDPTPGSVVGMGARVLVIDNYDSFVYNLVQYLGELGGEPLVHRSDALTLDQIDLIDPDAVLISPGPGRPEDAGISNEVIRHLAGRRPVFGVCLGHQCIGQVFGGEVVRAPEIMHGKTSLIHHRGEGVFAGMPNPFEATRYHSLVVDRDSVPDVLEITAETSDGTVMGLRHRELDIEGVQFHPESILTTAGHDLVANFLTRATAGAL